MKDFDEQTARLIELGVPAALGQSSTQLLEALEPLRGPASAVVVESDLPFVIVVPGRAEDLLALARPTRGEPFVDLRPKTSKDFEAIEGLVIPESPYLLIDVDCGRDFLDVIPEAALVEIRARGREPLTIAEGVALLLQAPDILEERNAFSLLGSRCGDQRVPALWTSRAKDRRGPRLGWCWARNPHSWLGSASCSTRLAAPT